MEVKILFKEPKLIIANHSHVNQPKKKEEQNILSTKPFIFYSKHFLKLLKINEIFLSKKVK